MLVYRTFKDLKEFLKRQVVSGKSIGFVPTMGALHEGHISLIKESKGLSDITVCSIFVNPTQFNVAEDLDKYPRTEEMDIQILSKNQCDVVFIPSVDEVYPAGYESPKVDLEGIDLVMEGKHRPGHFDGVMQVVGRFFEQIEPTFAFFGEKDYQQLAVIKKMVLKRCFSVKIIPCAIKREFSGLAMSSRNIRLSDSGLEDAKEISKTLRLVKVLFEIKKVSEIQKVVKSHFGSLKQFRLEYFEIADDVNLLPVNNDVENARAFIAVEIEGVRLIDNLGLN